MTDRPSQNLAVRRLTDAGWPRSAAEALLTTPASTSSRIAQIRAECASYRLPWSLVQRLEESAISPSELGRYLKQIVGRESITPAMCGRLQRLAEAAGSVRT